MAKSKMRKPHISSGAVVVQNFAREKRVLLLRRKKTKSWHLPKGTQEAGESILETALREVKEETGYSIAVERYLGRLVSLKENRQPKVTHYYLARVAGLRATFDAEHDCAKFFPASQAYGLLRKKSVFEKEFQVLKWPESGKKPLYIFDLDHTLFDTARFKTDMFSSLKGFNVPVSAVGRAYDRLMNRRGKFLYDYRIEEHLKLLQKQYVFPLKRAKTAFLKIFSRSRRYVYPGAFELLESLEEKGGFLALLTRGNREFNLRKASGSGLAEYFDTVIADYRDKVSALGRIIKKHGPAETWFTGDSVEELKEAARLYPGINCVLKLREDKPQPGKENFAQIGEIGDLRKWLA